MRLLLRFMKPYRWLAAGVLAVLLVDCAGTLLVPTMLAEMVNAGVVEGDFDQIVNGAVAMLVMSVLASGGAVFETYLSTHLAARVGRDIRNAIYDSSLAFSGGDFERFGTGSMITRTLNDINVIQMAIVNTVQMVLPVPVLCVVGIALACSIDWQMGMLLAIVVAVVLVVACLVVVFAAPIFMRLQRLIDRMNVVLRESIVGVRVIRAFTKERTDERRLDEVFSDYAESALRVNRMFAGLDSASFFFMNITEVAVLWVGGNRVGAHAMQIASISAVLEYAMLILFFIMMAQMVVVTLPRAKACLDRAAEIIDYVPQVRDAADASPLAPGAATAGEPVAAFEHVSFKFEDADEDTLHDLTFACRRGETCAIIGSTGSGKSTVAKLLLRFHDISEGSLRFCGRDVREIPQADLRARIAYVPQKAWLFGGTVASNLRFGNEGATDAEMRHALEVAQAGFVYGLPGRLEAPVAQGGTNLSGGQRQRLSIARALMKHADLYIFDDSFSALDFKTDAALRRALAAETRDAAVLIIAQRVSTIMNADRIVVLKEGAVAGMGTHEELMERCDVYQRIVRSQMKGGE